jgi:uncharacterized protein YdhG (YjbR/CyaY superfamily)
METKKPATIDEYIGVFSNEVQEILEKIRITIQESAPEAKEKISYSMPAFEQNGIIVYFAAFKNHIGLYALPSAHKAFREELSGYKSGKGSVQFPINQSIPYDLIAKIVKFRVKENLEKKMNSKSLQNLLANK